MKTPTIQPTISEIIDDAAYRKRMLKLRAVTVRVSDGSNPAMPYEAWRLVRDRIASTSNTNH